MDASVAAPLLSRSSTAAGHDAGTPNAQAGRYTHLPHLPALSHDVIVAIFSFIADDQKTLNQCSLVCHTWAHCTATHLFSSRRWPKCPHHWFDRRATRVQCSCALDCVRRGDGLTVFADFLAGSARVRTALRDVHFRFKLVRTTRTPMGWADLDAVLDVLAHLPALRSVVLAGITSHLGPAPSPARLTGRATRTLERLEVHDALHLGARALARVVAFFARVDCAVVVRAGAPLPDDAPAAAPDTPRTRLSTLRFETCSPENVAKYLDALADVVDTHALAHLQTGRLAPGASTESVARVLERAPQLESLSCVVSLAGTAEAHTASWRAVATLLGRCSPRVVTVTVSPPISQQMLLVENVRAALRSVDWADIDGVASRSQWLERIQLKWEGAMVTSQLEELNAALPDLRAALSPKVLAMLRWIPL
ncbi:hypothetical protein PsYK624_111450 [Phanerochaete sordida]|uniref:F-box domain-containing protein n=1 Tax=Phanerochaete sordida TaxID=48140 RepID=A0A9P3GF99_9APHY|nr:hypothetical protein PsYK624_111450 [Phanerochaete sordida]